MARAKSNEDARDPRSYTVEERRALFAAGKKQRKDDWRIVQPGQQESLVPTNILALDHGLRLYGLLRNGTVYHIHGDESSGKSTLTYALNREYQKFTGEPVGIFDFERTTKSWYLRNMGIDEDMAMVYQPDSIDQALKLFVDLLAQGVRLFTFDSIPRMRPMVDMKDIKSGDALKVLPGTHARAIQQFYDIVLPHIARVDGALLMVNQTRSRIEMTREAGFAAKGMDTVTNLNYSLPGGRANRFAASVMIETKTVKAWKPGKHEDPFILEPEALHGEDYLAHQMRLRSLKNKATGTGFRQASMWIRPGLGTDENISIRQYGRDLGMIANHGAKYFVGESYENPIVVYDNKVKALKDLVLDQNEEVLQKLKLLIAGRLQTDSSIGELDVDDDAQRYLSGEDDDKSDNYVGTGLEVDVLGTDVANEI